jgi:DNA-binding NarL/FixJ family response regulator
VVTPQNSLRQYLAEAAAFTGIALTPLEVARLSYQINVRAAESAKASLRLPPRLFDVLQGLAAGENLCETAKRLCISEDTVKTHRRRLYLRLGAKSGAHAVAIAGRAGLLLQVGAARPVADGEPVTAAGGRS